MLDGGRLSITEDVIFESDPRNLVRLFWLAAERQIDIHPHATVSDFVLAGYHFGGDAFVGEQLLGIKADQG